MSKAIMVAMFIVVLATIWIWLPIAIAFDFVWREWKMFRDSDQA